MILLATVALMALLATATLAVLLADLQALRPKVVEALETILLEMGVMSVNHLHTDALK